ncbi:MAG: hypothetical protein KAQ64_01390 [Candidatus Pacebacteria bacterium]|nr:hypothetical protein [Candidatus Paceibacterota bacterium]
MLKKILKKNKKIILALISILSVSIVCGAVFVFQKNGQSEQNKENKSLLEDFSEGGLRSAQSGNESNKIKNLKNYSSQAVLVDEIIDDNNNGNRKKKELSITQSLNFFAKVGNNLGIKREKIFQPVNKVVEFRESIKVPKIIKVPGDYKLIQLAIDNADKGDTVEVSAGEYKENIVMKEGVSLVGSNKLVVLEKKIEGEEEIKEESEEETESDSEKTESDSFSSSGRVIANETIINGGDSGNVVSFKNGITNKTEFFGFTVKNAGKNLSGIFIENSSPLISNNIITDNEYNIYIKGDSSPLIQKNSLRFGGKGVQAYNFEERENFIQSDKANEDEQNGFSHEAGDNGEKAEEEKEPGSKISKSDSFPPASVLSRPIIIDNLITDNKIGIDLYQASAIIDHNTISYNNHYKTYWGPTYGIYLNNSSAEILNNIITDSGICDLCAGMNIDEKSSGVMISYNNIWNNKNNFVCFGECVLEDNNFSEDPMFVDPVNWNFELQEESGLVGKTENGSDIGVRWQ